MNHSKPGIKVNGLQECSTTGITMHLTVFCAVSINWSVEILGRIGRTGTPCLLSRAVVYGGSPGDQTKYSVPVSARVCGTIDVPPLLNEHTYRI